uniref:Predicted protein n=1 Tax=Hordeum vulgare subsp. vulgare TaxID=112509 RepID=F2D990_HORVV|nr:predicted protein [Hordeum vulgare subsp. vulgare]
MQVIKEKPSTRLIMLLLLSFMSRGIVISLEDGTLKFLSLPTIANDVPVTGRPFAGTKTQGVHTYQLSEYLIWDVHVSEITGHAAYCVADGTAVHFQLTSRFWEKKPRRNRVPYFLCGSLAEEGTAIKIGSSLQSSPLSNVPMVMRKGPESCQDVDQADNMREEELLTLANSGKSKTLSILLQVIIGLLPDMPAELHCRTCRFRTRRW